jgi:4-hydroxy-3-methylbut-2-enyl diphosphate reductase IspH
MNSDSFAKLADLLQKRFKNIEIHNTLCSLPIKTQDEAIRLSKEVELMIIVGDKRSANTNTLYERIKKNTIAVFAETEKDLDTDQLKRYQKIGITGGSSTPDWQISEIQQFIEKLF